METTETVDGHPVPAIYDYEKFLSCTHCGFCLPACPTYSVLGLEMDSPRGRIYLMRSYAEGKAGLSDALSRHMFLCLGCRACETACPAGVPFGDLMERTRAEVLAHRPRPWYARLLSRMVMGWLLPSQRWLACLMFGMWLYQVTGMRWVLRKSGLLRLLPGDMARVEPLMPAVPAPWTWGGIRETMRPRGELQRRVGLLRGCVANYLFASTNRAAVRVLQRNGCEVITPKAQTCCGALHAHAGERDLAKALARRNIDAFESHNVDVILVTAAGCGATLKEYHHLLADDPEYADRARRFAGKLRDISEYLAGLRLNGHLGAIPGKVVYHDACHLAHGQRIREEPRALLRAIPGVELIEIEESDWCCGSAGTYNVTHPEMAGLLLERKMANIAAADPDIIVTGNPGCLIQIAHGARRLPRSPRVIHTIELLDEAYARAENAHT